MNKITHIGWHCSAAPGGGKAVIERWHKDRGFRTIGYHFVIGNGVKNYVPFQHALKEYNPKFDGVIELGRALDDDQWLESHEIGAHIKELGLNRFSIGVCFVGNRFFTLQQLYSGALLIASLAEHFKIPQNKILGHRESGANKGCPTMNEPMLRDLVHWFRSTKINAAPLAGLDPWEVTEEINKAVAKIAKNGPQLLTDALELPQG